MPRVAVGGLPILRALEMREEEHYEGISVEALVQIMLETKITYWLWCQRSAGRQQ